MSDLNIKVGDGVPVVSEAAPMRSSDEHLVCAKVGECCIGPILVMPNPSILAAAATCCRSVFSGSVSVVDGIWKSSCGSVIVPFSGVPLDTVEDVGLFHSG
jgi:hypothetical protein